MDPAATAKIPVGHTWFSWHAGGGARPPAGHTPFSWGEGSPASLGGAGGGIRKGFLEEKAPAVADVEHFLRTRVPEVLEQAEELHCAPEEDEERNPFQNRYKARELLKTIDKQLGACEAAAAAKSLATEWGDAVARVQLKLGVNFAETEEVSAGEKTLVQALERIKAQGEARFIPEMMDCTNHLGLIWSARGEASKAEGFLVKASDMYDAWVKGGKQGDEARMEALHTQTLFMMAQVYQHLGHPEMSAKYCQITLNRSLQIGEIDVDDWTKNAVQLSSYYLSEGRYRDCAACLAAAEDVLSKAGGEGERHETRLNLEWGWGKLHVIRLESKGVPSTPPETTERVAFDLEGLDKRIPDFIEQAIVTYEAACREMKAGLTRLDRARSGFKIDEDCSEHVQVSQDVAKLYRCLTTYSNSADDTCKMHKRRIDILEPIVVQLNIAAYDHLCKEIRHEVAEAYRDMLELKIYQVDGGTKKIKWDKLAELADGGIRNFTEFVKLFVATPSDPEAHLKLEVQGIGEEKVRRWYLLARFGMARCYLKRPDADINRRKQSLKQAIEEYQRLIDLVKKYPFQGGEYNFNAEAQISKEMVELLPGKIDRLHTLDTGLSGTA